ncbi:hypothetical protein QFC19_003599 [Naganishia cerealis]|uniref:Uncharacterized protein n=1 Tax=Naganishia cerealis TaxID=610337 RepID=A0ACC2W178_9TREE|nr:hypothetical protein QFC19_003599 [Naganishia cerealis]
MTQARALERLKQPFRSPMINDDKLRLLLRPSTNHSELATSSTTDSASSYTQLEGVVDQQQITVQNQTGPQYLHSERIVTERLASSFSSPFSSPFKDIDLSPSASAGSSVAYLAKKRTVKAIVHPKEDHTSSRISLSGEIAELERRKQILRQAIKIQRDPQEQHLRELVSQWKQAGRDIVEILYPIVPHPETQGHSNRIATSSWGTAPNDASSCGYETTQRTQEDAEVEDLKDWNYGAMMLSLQVDPQLLDWDEEAEDWEMQC